jgi:hypothetical protein
MTLLRARPDDPVARQLLDHLADEYARPYGVGRSRAEPLAVAFEKRLAEWIPGSRNERRTWRTSI